MTGDEVLRGRITDRNGPYLAAWLDARGLSVDAVTVIGDRHADIRARVAGAVERGVDLICVSGGLGPTHDDVTMEAVAQAAGRSLRVDPRALEMVVARSAGLSGGPANARRTRHKQAAMPEGAVVLEPPGTAPGCVLAVGGSLIVVLPGPPWELRQMWEAAATGLPALAALWERAGGGRERVVRLHGIGESQLVEVLDDPAAPSRQLIRMGICARDGELELTMRGRDQPVDALIDHLRASLGERLFSDDGRTVDALVAGALRARGETLAVAESCTGGGLGARITAQPGASDILRGGVIAYANEVKRALLGVPEEVLATDGAVSARCACAMASGAREALGSTWALATTGIAGPGEGSDEKPVGLVFVGLAGPHGVRAERHRLRGDREEVRRRTVACALHLLRREIVSA